MGDKQNFAGKTSWEILLLEDREGWHYNVTMCLREIGCVVRRWLELAQDRASVLALLNFRVPIHLPEGKLVGRKDLKHSQKNTTISIFSHFTTQRNIKAWFPGIFSLTAQIYTSSSQFTVNELYIKVQSE